MGTASYGELHKLFLQAMMSRCIVLKKTAVDHLKQISRMLGYSLKATEDMVTEIVDEINSKISAMGMEIKEVIAEYDSLKYIILVNTKDESSIMEKIDHIYSPKEREIFRVLIEAIILSGTYGSISSMDALHLNIPNGYVRPGEMQDAIEKIVADKWLIETRTGLLVPGPRTIAEFDVYLKRNYEEMVQDCPLCSNVIFYGVLCPHCDAITHTHCFKAFNSRRGANDHICPQPACKKPIPTEAVQEQQEEEASQTQSKKKGSKRGRKNATKETPVNTPSTSSQAETDNSAMEVAPAMEVDDTTPGPSTRRQRKRHSAD